MMKPVIIALACMIILLCLVSTALAQEPDWTEAVLSTEAIETLNAETMSGAGYQLDLYPSSSVGSLADWTEFWRLGMLDEAGMGLAATPGRSFGPTAAFPGEWGISDLYYMFPAPGNARRVEAAYFCILDRSGSSSGDAWLSLEVFDSNGSLQRVVSAFDINLESASTGVWNPVSLSADTNDWGVYPGEYLAFHVVWSGDAGDLDVRPAFEVQVTGTSEPPPPPHADLALTKSVAPAQLMPGETITYTLVYTNYGPILATNVVITDIAPSIITNLAAVHTGARITPTGAISYAWDVEDLSRNEGGIITITGQIDPDLPGSQWFTNTAAITGTVLDDNPKNNTSEAPAEVLVIPVLSLSKAVNPSADVTYHGEVTYTLVMSNTGPADAVETWLTDTLPSEVDFARWAESPQGTTDTGDEIRWKRHGDVGQHLDLDVCRYSHRRLRRCGNEYSRVLASL